MRLPSRAWLAILLLPALPVLPSRLRAQTDAPPTASRTTATARAIAPELRARIAERCQSALDALHRESDFPGGSAALVLADGSELTFTVGFASVEDERAMRPTDRLMSGSIGKTYVAAAALQAVAAGQLSLDDKAARHLAADHEWFARIPNAMDVTIRQLMRHQSGIPRYVLDPDLWKVLLDEPDRAWQPADCLAYVLDAEPLFPVGEGWAYSDTNFIVVGMVLEKVTGKPFYAYVREHLLAPHRLADTVPSDRRAIPGLCQGYAGMTLQLGVPERMLEDGVFAFNPQFEWCGGGFANTPLDLARWARILFSGAAFEGGGEYLDAMLDAVPAPGLGPGTRYGLGAIVRDTEAGRLVGHDGVFPGYQSTMGYFPERGLAAAFQVNRDGRAAVAQPMHGLLVSFARIVARGIGKRR